jgi:hypothetical protein
VARCWPTRSAPGWKSVATFQSRSQSSLRQAWSWRAPPEERPFLLPQPPQSTQAQDHYARNPPPIAPLGRHAPLGQAKTQTPQTAGGHKVHPPPTVPAQSNSASSPSHVHTNSCYKRAFQTTTRATINQDCTPSWRRPAAACCSQIQLSGSTAGCFSAVEHKMSKQRYTGP